jgi:hypothetical protein
MSCPKEKKIRTESDGTDVYEYIDSTTGRKAYFNVPVNHYYRCLKGEWIVLEGLTPPPDSKP